MSNSIISTVKQYVEQGEYKRAQELITSNRNNDPLVVANLNIYKVRILRNLGQFDQALKVANQSHSLIENLNDRKLHLKALIEESYVYWNLSKYDKTLALLENAQKLFDTQNEDVSEVEEEISTLDNLHGLVNLYTGNLNEGLRYFVLGLERRQRIGQKHMTAISLNNVGVCYYRRGELDKCIKYFDESIEIFNEINNSIDIVLPFSNLALAYYDLGKHNIALDYFEKSISIETELGNPINLAETYYGISAIYLKIGNAEKAEDYVEKLDKLSNGNDFLIIHQWYRLARARFLMTKLRIHQKIEAQELLSDILEEPVLHQRITIAAMKELCNFYIMELQLYGSEEALDDAIQLVNTLYDTAQDQFSFSLLVETLILNAKLSLIRTDFSSAMLLLDQAEFTSMERGLFGLEMQVKMEKVAIEAEADKWRKLSTQESTLMEKIEHSRILDYLKDITKIVDEY